MLPKGVLMVVTKVHRCPFLGSFNFAPVKVVRRNYNKKKDGEHSYVKGFDTRNHSLSFEENTGSCLLQQIKEYRID